MVLFGVFAVISALAPVTLSFVTCGWVTTGCSLALALSSFFGFAEPVTLSFVTCGWVTSVCSLVLALSSFFGSAVTEVSVVGTAVDPGLFSPTCSTTEVFSGLVVIVAACAIVAPPK